MLASGLFISQHAFVAVIEDIENFVLYTACINREAI
jgi:hypothetical protein